MQSAWNVVVAAATAVALLLTNTVLLSVSATMHTNNPSDATVMFPDTTNVAILHKATYARALQAVNFRKELTAAVNTKRTEKGLGSLCINTKLMTAAQVMANDMAKNDFVSATGSDKSSPSDRAGAQGYNSTGGVTELVAAGYESVRDVLDAWIKSSDTSSTLFGNFTHVGPGYTFNKNKMYWNYWVLDFATASTNETCVEQQ